MLYQIPIEDFSARNNAPNMVSVTANLVVRSIVVDGSGVNMIPALRFHLDKKALLI